MPRITVPLSGPGIGEAIRALTAYRDRVEAQTREVVYLLLEQGGLDVQDRFAAAEYLWPHDAVVTLENREGGGAIVASGSSVPFIEFGAGATYGDGHPLAGDFGFGPGTYNPSSDNWMKPDGWYLPKDVQIATGWRKSLGNIPNMPLYNTAQDLRDDAPRIVREVFGR